MNRLRGTKARANAHANGGSPRTRSSFADAYPTIGVDFDPDVAMVFERFDILFAE
jgi:hypothetical protein